jgi:hypothetical protein
VPYIEHNGESFDYIILRDDKEIAREALRALAISKRRAQRRLGTADLRSGNEIVSPLEVRRSNRRP